MVTTHCPAVEIGAFADRHERQVCRRVVDLHHAGVDVVIGAERVAAEAAAVGKFDPAFAASPADHVGGGEDQPFFVDDHPAAGGAADLDRDRGGHHAVDHLEELILDQLQLGGVRGRLGLQGPWRCRPKVRARRATWFGRRAGGRGRSSGRAIAAGERGGVGS